MASSRTFMSWWIDQPVKMFEGKIVVVINRKNDTEDKLAICDKSKNYSEEEIKKRFIFKKNTSRAK